jgi:hypothetical protein
MLQELIIQKVILVLSLLGRQVDGNVDALREHDPHFDPVGCNQVKECIDQPDGPTEIAAAYLLPLDFCRKADLGRSVRKHLPHLIDILRPDQRAAIEVAEIAPLLRRLVRVDNEFACHETG